MLYWNINIGGEDFSIPWVRSSPISGLEYYIWYDGYNPQTTLPRARNSSQWGDSRVEDDYKVMFEIAGVPIYGKSDKYFTPANSGHRYLYIKQDDGYVQLYNIQSNQGLAVGYPNTADFFKMTGIFLYFSHNYDGLETEPTKPRLQDLYISWQFYSEYRIQRSIYDDHTYVTTVSPVPILNNAYLENSFDIIAENLGAMYYRVIKGDVSPNLNLGQILIDRGLLTEQKFDEWLDEIETTDENGDDDAGGTGTNFGGGSWDDSSDNIEYADVPTVSAASSGLVNVYNPTPERLQDFANFLFSTDFVELVMKALYKPLDYVIQLNLIPFVPVSTTIESLKFLWYNTGIVCNKLGNNYQILPERTYTLQGYYGSFLDYDSSSVYLYVPFCGIHKIDNKLAVNSVIGIKYNADVLTGDCVAQVKFTKGNVDSSNLDSVVYHYRGNMSAQVPLNARDFVQSIRTISSSDNIGELGFNLLVAGLGDIESKGSITNNSSMLDSFEPYIIVQIPEESKPTRYVELEGIPSNIYYRLGSLKGFVRIVEGTFTNNVKCTLSERSEIVDLLEGGVYIE